MGKRRNSEPRADGIVELSLHAGEQPVRLDAARGALVLPDAKGAGRRGCGPIRLEGPIPLPDDMREYDHMLPGLASRIVEWAEREADHRRAMERSLLRLSWAGLWCALLVTLVTPSRAGCFSPCGGAERRGWSASWVPWRGWSSSSSRDAGGCRRIRSRRRGGRHEHGPAPCIQPKTARGSRFRGRSSFHVGVIVVTEN